MVKVVGGFRKDENGRKWHVVKIALGDMRDMSDEEQKKLEEADFDNDDIYEELVSFEWTELLQPINY